MIVADEHSQPDEIRHPGLFLPAVAQQEADDHLSSIKEKPHPSPNHRLYEYAAVSLLASKADGQLKMYVNGILRLDAKIEFDKPEDPVGTHLFMLMRPGPEADYLSWVVIGYNNAPEPGMTSSLLNSAVIHRIHLLPDDNQVVADYMHQGTTLLVTDLPATSDTHSGSGFTIITQEDGWGPRPKPSQG